ncbi:hypothetical protein V6Z11_A04G051400 [Gossypium hirsutum]|uniref:Uncharacterized protein n=1 Tax=Gossypium hirsutum TaxID=3635 RepID=A0ABM3BID6_GOSHI|nr:uncharacterized protein LOC121227926 [Gossypium hirsutum]
MKAPLKEICISEIFGISLATFQGLMDDTFGYSFQFRSQRSEQRSMADLQDSAVRRSGETCEGGHARSRSLEPNSLVYSRSFWCSRPLNFFLGSEFQLGLGYGFMNLG